MSNKYIGSSPTAAGASAISKNSKLTLSQGYVTTNGQEVVQYKNFYIDEVKQLAGAAVNTMQITARDSIKKLANWRATQQIQYSSQYKFYDNFADLSNWTVIQGSWSASGNTAQSVGSQGVEGALVLNAPNLANFDATVGVQYTGNVSGSVQGIFCRYQDINNLYLFGIYTNGGANPAHLQFYKRVSGSYTTLSDLSMGQAFTTGVTYYIRIIAINNTFYFYWGTTPGAFTYLGSLTDNTYSTGLMGLRGDTPQQVNYSNFIVHDLTPDKSVEYLITDLAAKSGIQNQSFDSTFSDTFANLSNWIQSSGVWTASGNQVSSGGSGEEILLSNSTYGPDFEFTCNITTTSTQDFMVVFRASDSNNFYAIQQNGAFYKRVSGTYTQLSPGNTAFSVGTNKTYQMRLVIQGNWFSYYLNGVALTSIYDSTYTAAGKIGFRTNASIIKFDTVRLPQLWQPVPTFTLHPGDDGLSAVQRLADIQKALFWITWDDKLKVRQISSSDASVYTYTNVQTSNNYNQPDNQFNHVVVYGSNSTVGEAWDYTNIQAIGEERFATVTDLTLTTNTACSNLATQILNKSKRGASTSTLTVPNNVGLELNDVITLSDPRTGQASSSYRVKALNPQYDASTALYQLAMETEQVV